MRRIRRAELIDLTREYFELPTEEKEYLQHWLWDLVQDYRASIIKEGGDVTSWEIYIDLLQYWREQENYRMCQLIHDSAKRYEIDPL